MGTYEVMFYNAILVVIPATALAGVTGDLQKVFQACRCMLLYTLLIALQLLVFLTFIIFSSSSSSLLQFLFFPPPISLLPSSNFSSSSCFPLFPLIIAYLAVISYLDKLVQPSYLLCTQFILAFLLNYLTLLSSFCLFFLAFASLAISLSITKVPEWQLPQQVWLSHFLSFWKMLSAFIRVGLGEVCFNFVSQATTSDLQNNHHFQDMQSGCEQ